jgi:16S rRNA (cytidine1402-2'-O)-methyltransferase
MSDNGAQVGPSGVSAPPPSTIGSLYLIPNILGEGVLGEGVADRSLLPHTCATIARLSTFLVEDEKSARRLLKLANPERPLRDVVLNRLSEHTGADELDTLIEPLRAGISLGVISEAGCPAIADPGAAVVARAHRLGARVYPLVGPCSMVLALMASGFNGQRWRFSGYPPREEPARHQALRGLERDLRSHDETQILMETPYRNQRLFSELLGLCHPQTGLCIALSLTTPHESIRTHTIQQWRSKQLELPKVPALFLLGTIVRNYSPGGVRL